MKKIFFTLFVFIAFQTLAKENHFSDKDKIKAYLQQSRFNIDTAANAVYLATRGEMRVGYSIKKIYQEIRVEKMAKIIREQGMDVADVSFDLLPGEKLSNVITKVYRLTGKKLTEQENGQPVKIEEGERKNKVVLKFGNLKVGDIIYYSYAIKSDGMLLPAWYLQEFYPNLHAELILTQQMGLDFFIYSNTGQQYQVSTLNELDHCEACKYGDAAREVDGQFRTLMWGRNNIPAVGSLMGYAVGPREMLQFQIKSLESQRHLANMTGGGMAGFMRIDAREGFIKDIALNSWKNVNDILLYGGRDFGAQLNRKNNELDNVMGTLLSKAGSDKDKAANIFSFVRDSIALANDGIFMANNDVKTAFDSRSGSLGEKNLLLVMMLRHAGFNAEPVVLCKGNNDNVRTDFCNFASLNYVLTLLTIGEDKIYLDPSTPAMPFGQLLPDCYNKLGFVTSEKGSFTLLPDSKAKDKVNISVALNQPASGAMYEGTVKVDLSLPSAMQFREAFLRSGKHTDEATLNKFAAAYFRTGFDTLLSCSVVGLASVDGPLQLIYRGRILGKEHFVPYLFQVTNQPFKSSGRIASEWVYMLDMDLSGDEAIKPLPASRNLRFGDNQIAYSGNGSVNNTKFRLLYRLLCNKPPVGRVEDFNAFSSDIRRYQEQSVSISR